jgi:hypothetical protein
MASAGATIKSSVSIKLTGWKEIAPSAERCSHRATLRTGNRMTRPFPNVENTAVITT